MPYRANQIECIEFSMDAFIGAVIKASGAPEGAPPNTQTRYLARYLRKDLRAKSILVENSYVDRHFVEEFALYYSRCLGAIPNTCVRLHLFSTPLTEELLDALIERAAKGEASLVRKELDEAYLGFIVVRPLPSVPIGRTVLKVPQDLEARRYESITRYSVHVLGFELTVRGIAFQQQDVAVAACATTALWTALQRMARHEGGRAPTPSAITQAAVKNLWRGSGPTPGRGGLLTEQYCEALRSFNFGAEVIEAGKEPHRFEQIVGIYLRSGIPVILSVVSVGGRGHAVAVVGYRRTAHTSHTTPEKFTVVGDGGADHKTETVTLRHENTAHDRLFIHDDRLGPYASATLVRQPDSTLCIEIKRHAHDCDDDCQSGSDCKTEKLAVRHATIPLYPKLRSSAKDLLENARELKPPIMKSALSAGATMSLELYFERSGNYASSLYEMHLSVERVGRFQRSASLSRYVGVARWSLDEDPILDFIWDTTDIRRNNRVTNNERLLAIVALHPAYEVFADEVAKELRVLAG